MSAGGAQPPLQLPGGLAACRRALAVLGTAELFLATLAFAFVVVLTIVQVVLRYGFHGSIWWAQEVSQLAILVSYFLGIAYVFKARQDVMIQFVFERMAPQHQMIAFVVAEILTVVLAVIAAFMLVVLAPQQLGTKTYILSIPKFYSNLPLLVGSVSMILTAAYFLVAVLTLNRQQGRERSLLELEDAVLIARTGPLL